jgi:selenocysteine-specific elongation factor
MHVVATAGHVDHGKSTLVAALTGRDPDRYAEEKRRGMTLDLGFAWTTLPSGQQLAFVDVPGHERFVSTMLAGVGPVPAVVFVVAADEGWQPQSQEHADAIDAMGASHGLLVVTKSDLADPAPALAQARERLGATSLSGIDHLAVSARDPASMTALRDALDGVVATLPEPDLEAPVRLWVDRVFSIRGAGIVVTGTLPQGVVRVGDRLCVVPTGSEVVVRGLESMERPEQQVRSVARAAVNLRGASRDDLARGMALVTPDAWTVTRDVDVLVEDSPRLPARLMVHIGSAAVSARCRPLGDRALRLRLETPMPLHVTDRLVLRDPGRHEVLGGAVIADVRPPDLRRRGAAVRRAQQLPGLLTADAAVAQRGAVTARELVAAGHQPPVAARAIGEWWVSPRALEDWQRQLAALLRERAGRSQGVTVEDVSRQLAIPDTSIAAAVVAGVDGLEVTGGYVRRRGDEPPESPAMSTLRARLAAEPLAAPEASEVSLDPAELALAVRAREILHLGHGVYVGPQAPTVALERLRSLTGPFTMAEARTALGTTRRVAVPLLEHLDALRRTRRVDGQLRVVVAEPEP